MKFRRRTVAGAVALAAAGIAVAVTVATVAPAQAATALKSLAEAKARYFGTALTVGDVNNSGEMNVATAQFDMVTPGNEMKWDTTERSNGSYNFGRAIRSCPSPRRTTCGYVATIWCGTRSCRHGSAACR